MAVSDPDAATPATVTPRLRRGLNVWQAVGLSIALMAPSMAANINPQGTAKAVGRAVPLAFLIATVGVLLVAYVFVRLCQRFHHAGSVYAFVAATLGARAGTVAGWSLMGTYCFYGVVTSTACGIFGTAFLQQVGLWAQPPDWAPFLISGLALVLVWLLTVIPVRGGTRVLLSVEGITVALILVVSVAVLARLIAGTAPEGLPATWSVFTLSPGTEVSAVFLGAVFGFLSFAGFEASATLGEEAREPRRDIPRAILGTAIFGGLYFVFVTAVEVMGFGADADGVAAFTSSPSLLGDLGTRYVGPWVGDLISLGAAVSAFGCALACAVGGSRLLFALSRDAAGSRGLGGVSRQGTPALAAVVVVLAMYGIVAAGALGLRASAMDVFLASGTIGTLILLVVYLVTTLGAIRLLFFTPPLTVRRWELVIPLAALVVLGYTVYANVVPYPEGAAAAFPIVAGGWILLGILAVAAVPRLARFAQREDLTAP
ncbi:APC family permease [Pseudonocardia acaciae]|uniref:APC family permease n=1 Tax=Pseudonocardia acaciae TaxID=551276 RepID=UPI000686451C|nr:APC family permease [Pseudonocardia acaciae]